MSKKLVSLLAVCGVVLLTMALPVMAAKSHEVKTQVVAVDAKAMTLTIKDEKGASKTVKVLDAAAANLKDVKAGDNVTLTCQDSDTGEHQGIVAIHVDKKEKPA